MNINSRIDWKAGMAISAQTFWNWTRTCATDNKRQPEPSMEMNSASYLSPNSTGKVVSSATNWK